ncbi:hypothetical protein [Fulvivirga lutea]|uniref:Uncharacterized protein n=1 Tax=Fulvivirga lutea TaxID=2810512 RepID=A0A975A1T2_9BACT|nr:hypothetical protein [Fulvivirga lutea]QSE98676.1 hypothetical protein JR347_06240 [Fulvivirga lutea]
MIDSSQLKNRTFIEYLSGIKKAVLFFVAICLTIIIPLWSSIDLESNLVNLLFLSIFWIGIILWIIYLLYAQHKRLIKDLKETGVYRFLTQHGFKILETSNGWNYIITISGKYQNARINIVLDYEKGNLWHKYYLYLEGLTKLEKKQIHQYPKTIKLTKNDTILSDLKYHLEIFATQLNEVNPDFKS